MWIHERSIKRGWPRRPPPQDVNVERHDLRYISTHLLYVFFSVNRGSDGRKKRLLVVRGDDQLRGLQRDAEDQSEGHEGPRDSFRRV